MRISAIHRDLRFKLLLLYNYYPCSLDVWCAVERPERAAESTAPKSPCSCRSAFLPSLQSHLGTKARLGKPFSWRWLAYPLRNWHLQSLPASVYVCPGILNTKGFTAMRLSRGLLLTHTPQKQIPQSKAGTKERAERKWCWLLSPFIKGGY